MTEKKHASPKKTQTIGLARGLTNYGDADFSLYMRRSFAKSMGYSPEMLARPVVGIAQTASGFNNCHRHFPELVEAVKRGVIAAGGLALDFPTISLGEIFLSPTSMMFRNLMSMDVEEMIRAQPMDAVVLIGGCDKTVPAQLMGAASADVPAIQLVGGPMMPSSYKGERLGACTDCRRFWAKFRSNEVSAGEIAEIEGSLVTTAGSCAVMGTASTMASIAEALGMTLPGTAAIPAVHADRLRAAEASGRAAMELIALEDQTQPSDHGKIGGERAACVARHRRLDQRDHPSHGDCRAPGHHSLARAPEPTLRNHAGPGGPEPTGQYYMSDLHAAGGIGAVLRELKPLLHLDCMTVSGDTMGERLAADTGWVDRNVVRTLAEPYQNEGGLAALFGTLAPNGAIIKRSAADPKLFEREGRAVVFESLDDLAARIDSPELDVMAEDFLVLQNAGPKSGYAMPEAGYLPIPMKLSRAGREGHGAHFRCAHERHRVWHRGAACVARIRDRRAARAGAKRRPYPTVGVAA